MPRRFMLPPTLVFIVLLASVPSGAPLAEEPAPAGKPTCASKLEARNSDLTLDYDGFDQTPGQGWRVLMEEGCPREAAELIQAYLKQHGEMPSGDRRNLSFHAGQVLALDDDYAEAIPLFKNALREKDEAADAPFQWNAYVKATIAFLERDRAAVQAQRDIMAHAGELNGRAPNLDVVDALLRNFDKPYSSAYGTR